MEFIPLEINVISAKDLKDVNLFTKMDVYVVVSINGDFRTAQRTPVDKNGGSNPEWNYTVRFTVDEAAARQNGLTVVFILKSQRQLGDRDIGTVQVPVKELLDKGNGNGKGQNNLSYAVRLANGKAKGVLNFSYKFGDKFTQPSATVAGAMNVDKQWGNEKPVMAYPPPSSGYMDKPAMAYPPPATAYPGPSSGYRPSHGAYPPPPQTASYPYPQPGGGYPPYGYQQAPVQGYGYSGQGGYYGYPPVQKPQKPKKGGGGMGAELGLGLAGGLLGGMLIGDMVGDAYEAGLEDGIDFDF